MKKRTTTITVTIVWLVKYVVTIHRLAIAVHLNCSRSSYLADCVGQHHASWLCSGFLSNCQQWMEKCTPCDVQLQPTVSCFLTSTLSCHTNAYIVTCSHALSDYTHIYCHNKLYIMAVSQAINNLILLTKLNLPHMCRNLWRILINLSCIEQTNIHNIVNN